MITLVEALEYRCLRHVHRPLVPFHVLVGPNASGKSTFLDVVSFLGRLVGEGLEAAVSERTSDLRDLVWNREPSRRFELAIETEIPAELTAEPSKPDFKVMRYEVGIGEDAGEPMILHERGLLRRHPTRRTFNRTHFPMDPPHFPYRITTWGRSAHGTKTIFNKATAGNDNYNSETRRPTGKGRALAFKLGPRKSTLGNLPEDESMFPVATWLKNVLVEGVQSIILNSAAMRKASPPGQPRTFKSDGSNLPWVIERLKEKAPSHFEDWIGHLTTALPDLETIRTVEREDDRHRYLVLRYRNGLEVPSWIASDGTLRLLALTLPAYLPDLRGIFLIEEPENGIHPTAVDTMYRALSSVHRAQILLATHSPVILSQADPEAVLCFGKTESGATDIIRGSEHPRLKNWRGETNLGSLFAAGVLG